MKKKQGGMALPVSLVLLMGALVVAVGGAQTAQLEEMSAGNHRSSVSALMAAEFGASEQLGKLKVSSQGPSDFSSCGADPAFGKLESVINAQNASAGYRVETCRSGDDAIKITVRGESGGLWRDIQVGYTKADSTFLGLSAINFPGKINSFNAPNSNSFIVEGAVGDNVSGGQRPAISTGTEDGYNAIVSAISAIGRQENYEGGISDVISESILTNPVSFLKFIDGVKSYAQSSPSGQVVSSIDKNTAMHDMITVVTGDVSLNGNASGSGILIVEGDYGTSGTPQFDGLIIVLGNTFGISGGGNGGMRGGLVLAPLPLITDESGNSAYSEANVETSGGGNAAYSYDADVLTDAFNLLPQSLQQEWKSNNSSTYAETTIASWKELL